MYLTYMANHIQNFNVLNLIRCKHYTITATAGEEENQKYFVVPAYPAKGILYVTQNNLQFISGHIRVRGRNNGSYPYNYLEMIDMIFGKEDKTIEVCSGMIRKYNNNRRDNSGSDQCFTVDINPKTNPDLVEDGQTLSSISNNTFNRWRSDPPYNAETAKEMYGTCLPETAKLLKAGARVCKVGSLMFLLLGPKNYQICPQGVKRIGWIGLTVIPNNELRTLNIYYKYADPPELL
jgi:hypothetical protein